MAINLKHYSMKKMFCFMANSYELKHNKTFIYIFSIYKYLPYYYIINNSLI